MWKEAWNLNRLVARPLVLGLFLFGRKAKHHTIDIRPGWFRMVFFGRGRSTNSTSSRCVRCLLGLCIFARRRHDHFTLVDRFFDDCVRLSRHDPVEIGVVADVGHLLAVCSIAGQWPQERRKRKRFVGQARALEISATYGALRRLLSAREGVGGIRRNDARVSSNRSATTVSSGPRKVCTPRRVNRAPSGNMGNPKELPMHRLSACSLGQFFVDEVPFGLRRDPNRGFEPWG